MLLLNRAADDVVPCPAQDFLRAGGTLQELEDKYSIHHRRHTRYPQLVQLKYDQILSPFNEPIVQEARGVILDSGDQWRVVARPFKKFFNHGEVLAEELDWLSVTVQEKLDGSLMIMYWYDNKWQIASSGTPDASGFVGDTTTTFEELFWSTWYRQRFEMPSKLHANYTLMFELTSPFNPIVVRHNEAKLHLIGIRSAWTGNEMPVGAMPALNPVRQFPLHTIDQVLATLDKMDPYAQEGYVAVDKRFHRRKVKCPKYVALHHLKSSFSMRKIVELVMRGEGPEIMAAFPEWIGIITQVQALYHGLADVLQQHWEATKHITIRKDFAAEAKKSPYYPVMFRLFDKAHPTALAALGDTHVDGIIEVLGLKGVKLTGTL